MKVKILCGAYGHHIGNIVKPVYRGEVVDLGNEEAEDIVKIGAAEYVPEAVSVTIPEPEDIQTGGNLPEEPEAPEEGILATTDGPLEEMSFSELKRVAVEIGIENIGRYRSKAALIEAIKDNTIEVDETMEEPPVLTAAEAE